VAELTLIAPRGYCAGVDRAIETVEQALRDHGAPIYVRGEIVHNKHVVNGLAEKGAVFVASPDDCGSSMQRAPL
jgi:4-hydroxy-3-methylbut-2-enyl diphosphate reductase